MEVHTQLGCGFLEAVYQEALEIELTNRKIPYTSQQEILITYKNRPLKKTYVADLVAYNKIILELKAIDLLTGREEAQLINYLKASGMEVGLLFNFGSRTLEWLRRANTEKNQAPTNH